MRSSIGLIAAVLAACGSNAPRAAPQGVAQRAAPPAPPTCAEIALILRGPIDAGDESAGPDRVKAIEMSCTRDRWPQAVIECAASSTKPADCTQKLDDVQRSNYDRRLRDWARTYGIAADGEAAPAPSTFTAAIPCTDALHAPDLIDPPLDDAHPERAWAAAQRFSVLRSACETDPWTEDLKTCLRDATTPSATAACGIDARIAKQLADIRVVAKAIEALRKKPSRLGCPQVVEHHYGDAKWKGKLAGATPADRKKAIADSRVAMLHACKDTPWDEAMRACVIADGGDVCFGTGLRWGYPVGVAASGTGIPECDAYGAAVTRLILCDKLPGETREAMRKGFELAASGWASLPPAERAPLADECKTAASMVEQSLTASGC